MKNGEYLTYYLESSALDHIFKHKDRDVIVALLKVLREKRKAVSYLSGWNVSELVAAYENKPEVGRGLVMLAREIAIVRAIKDTPELLHDELHRLSDPSVNVDLLLPMTSTRTSKMQELIAGVIDNPADYLSIMKQIWEDARRRKVKDAERWEAFVREMNEKTAEIDKKDSPFTDVASFFDWAFNHDTFGKTAVNRCMPTKGYFRVTGDDVAARLDETVSFRAFVYFELSAIYYKWIVGWRRYQKHWGDAIDTHHVIYAAHFDIFVTDDENCRQYATMGAEGRQKLMSLEEFLDFVPSL